MVRILIIALALLALPLTANAWRQNYTADPACSFEVQANAPGSPSRAEILCNNLSGGDRFWNCQSSPGTPGYYDCTSKSGLTASVQSDSSGYEFWYDFADELCGCIPENAPTSPEDTSDQLRYEGRGSE